MIEPYRPTAEHAQVMRRTADATAEHAQVVSTTSSLMPRTVTGAVQPTRHGIPWDVAIPWDVKESLNTGTDPNEDVRGAASHARTATGRSH